MKRRPPASAVRAAYARNPRYRNDYPVIDDGKYWALDPIALSAWVRRRRADASDPPF